MRKDVRNEIIRIGGDNINKSEMVRIMGCSRQTIYNREERLKNLKYPHKLNDYIKNKKQGYALYVYNKHVSPN